MSQTPDENPTTPADSRRPVDPRGQRESGNGAAELARQEKTLSRRVSLGRFRVLLIAAFVLFLVSLALPFTEGARGFDVLLFTESSTAAGVTLAERVFTILMTLGVGLGNAVLLLTRRTWVSHAAWIITGIGLFYSVFALWMQQTQPGGGTSGIGMYFGVAAVILATIGLSSIILRRDPAQAKVAAQRAQSDNLDEVGYAQRDAMVTRQATSYEDNPLFVDDRRARANQRHRNTQRRREGNTPTPEQDADREN